MFIILEPHELDIDETFEVAEQVENLRKFNKNELGFIPQSGFAERLKNDRMVIALLKSENFEQFHLPSWTAMKVIGFMTWGKVRETVTIYMACVGIQFRRNGIASAMIRRIEKINQRGSQHFQCRVREDLEANKFWLAAGFTRYDQVEGGKQRNLMINRYERRANSLSDNEGDLW